MGSLTRVWTQKRLSLGTKLRIYQKCILPIAIYESETWTLLSVDTKWMQAFHMRCHKVELWASGGRTGYATPRPLRQSVCLRSVTLLTQDGLHCLDTWSDLENGHQLIVRSSSHSVSATGDPPSPSWRQPRGRARDTWLKPLMHSGTSIQSQWDSAV